MDLKIVISDEDDYVLDIIKIYQDGSDIEGADKIRDMIEMKFDVEDDDSL